MTDLHICLHRQTIYYCSLWNVNYSTKPVNNDDMGKKYFLPFLLDLGV